MNQYRCDNGCKYFEQHYCNFLHDRLANIEIVHIERVGCASHSDFQSERDTVLDEPERLKDCKNCHLPCSQTGKEISFYGKCPEFRFGNQTPSEGDLVVRESVKMFAVLMEAKLRKNDYKSHWSKESFTYLFGRLDEEMKELNQAVSSAKTDYERIADEVIDVANFLMMIVDNMEELRQQQGDPR